MTVRSPHNRAAHKAARLVFDNECFREWLGGKTMQEIADDADCGIATVKRSVTRTRERLREENKQLAEDRQAIELAKIELVEREAWEGIEKIKKRLSKRGTVPYLRVLLGCIARRCKMFGLDAPAEVHATVTNPELAGIFQEAAEYERRRSPRPPSTMIGLANARLASNGQADAPQNGNGHAQQGTG